jgi:regulator of replication initiation timing
MTQEQLSDVLRLAKYHQLERLQWKIKFLVYEIYCLDMEIKKKKSILATLDDIIESLKDKLDGIPEVKSIGSYKEGFHLVRNERTIAYTEPGADKGNDNPKNTYFNDSNTEVFYASGDWKEYHNCLQSTL